MDPKQSELRYDLTLDNLLEGVQIIDENWRYVYVNESVAVHGRSTREALTGQKMSDVYAGIEETEMFSVLRECMETREPRQMENKFVFPNGSTGWFKLSFQPVPEGVLILSVDITALKTQELHTKLLNDMSKIAKVGAWELDVATMKQQWTDETFAIHDREQGVYDPNSTKEISRFEPGSREKIEKAFDEAMRLGKPYDLEAEMTTVKGNRKWVRAVCSPLTKDGKVIRLTGTLQDITARKQAEENLRTSEEKFKSVFNNSLIGRSITQPSGELQINQAYADMLGYSTDELQNKNWREITHPEDVERSDSEVAAIPAGEKESARFLKRYIRKDGKIIWTDMSTFLHRDEHGNPDYFISDIIDITERKQAEEQLRESEASFKAVFENAPVGISLLDPERNLTVSNKMLERIVRISKQGLLDGEYHNRKYIREDGSEIPTSELASTRAIAEKKAVRNVVNGILLKNGEVIWTEVSAAPLGSSTDKVVVITQDISERKRHEAISQSRLHLSEFSQTHSMKELLEEVINEAEKLTGSKIGFMHFVDEDEEELSLQGWSSKTKSEYCKAEGEDSHYPISEAGVWVDCVRQRKPVIHNNYEALAHRKGLPEGHAGLERELVVPVFRSEKISAILGVGNKSTDYTEQDVEIVSRLADLAWDIAATKQAQEALHESERRYHSLFENSPIALYEEDFSAIKNRLDELRQSGVEDFRTYFADHPDEVAACTAMVRVLDGNKAALALEGVEQKKDLLRDLTRNFKGNAIEGFEEQLIGIADGAASFEWEGRNRMLDDRLIDVQVQWSVAPGHEDSYAKVLVALRDITARKQAEANIKLQLERMTTLSKIDRAISSTMDMRVSLSYLLSNLVGQLGPHAASILLWNPTTFKLEHFVSKGFQDRSIREVPVTKGQALAGQVLAKRNLVHVSNLKKIRSDQSDRIETLLNEKFLEYYGLPLISKGELKGVIEILHREPLKPDANWLNYLNTFSVQAAIAIDNAQLFNNLQKSNFELLRAYDATISGWSRAMDLRDEETEGHTQRVTAITLELATAMGINQQAQVHMRRGALLHDIGKLGVPDHVLLKEGPLNEAEWALMRQHPTFAHEMLSTIEYLKPALDIPYCHHEKWDGSGYPRGLAGEQIPLAARIFAVVDVYDALTSDRPYRSAWSKQEALEHIREQSGIHFDPKVVNIFMKTFHKRSGI